MGSAHLAEVDCGKLKGVNSLDAYVPPCLLEASTPHTVTSGRAAKQLQLQAPCACLVHLLQLQLGTLKQKVTHAKLTHERAVTSKGHRTGLVCSVVPAIPPWALAVAAHNCIVHLRAARAGAQVMALMKAARLGRKRGRANIGWLACLGSAIIQAPGRVAGARGCTLKRRRGGHVDLEARADAIKRPTLLGLGHDFYACSQSESDNCWLASPCLATRIRRAQCETHFRA